MMPGRGLAAEETKAIQHPPPLLKLLPLSFLLDPPWVCLWSSLTPSECIAYAWAEMWPGTVQEGWGESVGSEGEEEIILNVR